MVEPTPFRRPVNWAKIRTDEAERIIRERAEDSGNVYFGIHAFERVDERSITQPDAIRILRTGHVDGPLQRNLDGEWEATIVKKMPGCREAGVVTIVYQEGGDLFVKTVEWMDWNR